MKFSLEMCVIVLVNFCGFTLGSRSMCKRESRHSNCDLLPVDGRCGLQRLSPMNQEDREKKAFTRQKRMVGGEDAKLWSSPWIALLHSSDVNAIEINPIDDTVCAATIINEKYLLTVAHCFDEMNINSVRVGEYSLSLSEDCSDEDQCNYQSFGIENVTIHKGYVNRYHQHDICLVRVKGRIRFNDYVSPVCLPFANEFRNEDTFLNQPLSVAGWGVIRQSPDVFPDTLQTVEVPYVPRDSCQRVYDKENFTIDESKLCAGGEALRDACGGDSGGPLTGGSTLLGIVSFGVPGALCGTEGVPGVYVNVNYYLTWILDNMRP